MHETYIVVWLKDYLDYLNLLKKTKVFFVDFQNKVLQKFSTISQSKCAGKVIILASGLSGYLRK
jgi:hypothetical protein